MVRLLLIDGLNLIRRIYAGQPDGGVQARIEAVTEQSVRAILKNLGKFSPSHAVLAMEYSRHNWRRKYMPSYKVDRPGMPTSLRKGLPDLVQSIAEIGVREIAVDGFEADDIIATLAQGVVSRGGQGMPLSTDRLLCQLLNQFLQLYYHFGNQRLDEAF